MELNTILLVIIGVFLLYLALNGKLKNVAPAYKVLIS